jgi:hypothetical protein
MNDLLKILVGIALGITLVLSCGDDSPTPADAAVCDCAPAEAPIASRIVQVVNTETLSPRSDPFMGRGGESVLCPPGALLLNGGCTATVGQVPDIVIEQSKPNGQSWSCAWRNNSNEPVEVRVIANCLMPAQ